MQGTAELLRQTGANILIHHADAAVPGIHSDVADRLLHAGWANVRPPLKAGRASTFAAGTSAP
jgi:hypothetical protein